MNNIRIMYTQEYKIRAKNNPKIFVFNRFERKSIENKS